MIRRIGFVNCVRLLEETKYQMNKPMVLMDKFEIIRPEVESLVKIRGDIGEELFESLKAKTLMLEKVFLNMMMYSKK